MSKKKSPELSIETKIWWLFNTAVVIQLIIYFTEQLHGTFSANNPFIHFIYNVTSIFFIIPYYLISLFSGLVLGFRGINELLIHFYDERLVSNLIVVLAAFLGLATNYLLAKLLSQQIIIRYYERYLKKHTLVLVLIVGIILFLFAVG